MADINGSTTSVDRKKEEEMLDMQNAAAMERPSQPKVSEPGPSLRPSKEQKMLPTLEKLTIQLGSLGQIATNRKVRIAARAVAEFPRRHPYVILGAVFALGFLTAHLFDNRRSLKDGGAPRPS